MSALQKTFAEKWRSWLVYSLVALILLLPLLKPGYILTLDLVFTPKLALPTTVTSSFLFHAGLHYLNLFIPSQVLEKLILFASLFLSGLGMHQLMVHLRSQDMERWSDEVAAYAAGLLYMINPFVYSRFMAGQYSVLLGYAGLPFFVLALWRFLREPSLKKSLVLAAWTVGLSIVSIHALGLMAVLTLVTLAQTIIRHRDNRGQLKQLAKYGLVASLVFIVASSYWILPLALGNGSTAMSISTFQTSDQSAFATGGNGVAGKLTHVARLQGFWGERHDLFLLPQDELRMWGLFVIAVWGLVIIGARAAWRQEREAAVLFIGSTLIAALLSAGVGTAWLASHVSLFAGYREPQKFVAIMALGYAVFVGFAVRRLLGVNHTKVRLVGTAIAFLIILIGFTPVMFRGFDGQLGPVQYPADWYAINERLNQDKSQYQVLSLPWHLYMTYQFAGRVIANPSEGFFDKSLLVSDNPELGSVPAAVPNAQKQLLTHLLAQAGTSKTLGHQLLPLDVKYVLLAKDSDYRAYDYLDHQTDLQLVSDSPTLKLYRNTAFGKEAE